MPEQTDISVDGGLDVRNSSLNDRLRVGWDVMECHSFDGWDRSRFTDITVRIRESEGTRRREVLHNFKFGVVYTAAVNKTYLAHYFACRAKKTPAIYKTLAVVSFMNSK